MYENKVIVCPKCGKVNTLDSKFCIGCGKELDPSTAIIQQSAENNQSFSQTEKDNLLFYFKKMSGDLSVIKVIVVIYFVLTIIGALSVMSRLK